jgi:hypothetical protein
MEHGCNDSPGTFGTLTLDANYQVQQPLAQFSASQLINLEWVQPNGEERQSFTAQSDVDDGGGHTLVAAYALKRLDGQWSLMIVNRDRQNAHRVRIFFQSETDHAASSFVGKMDIATFGKDQYQWHPESLGLRRTLNMQETCQSWRIRRAWPIRMGRLCIRIKPPIMPPGMTCRRHRLL